MLSFLWKNSRWCPVRLGRLDKVHGMHSACFLILESRCPRVWLVPCRVYRTVIRLMKLDSVLHRFNRTEVANPRTFKLGKRRNNFIAVWRTIIWYRLVAFPVDFWTFVWGLHCVTSIIFLVTALKWIIEGDVKRIFFFGYVVLCRLLQFWSRPGQVILICEFEPDGSNWPEGNYPKFGDII